MGDEAVMMDGNIYTLIVGGALMYGVTLLNTIVPNAEEVSNPLLKAVLKIWEAASGNFLKNANRRVGSLKEMVSKGGTVMALAACLLLSGASVSRAAAPQVPSPAYVVLSMPVLWSIDGPSRTGIGVEGELGWAVSPLLDLEISGNWLDSVSGASGQAAGLGIGLNLYLDGLVQKAGMMKRRDRIVHPSVRLYTPLMFSAQWRQGSGDGCNQDDSGGPWHDASHNDSELSQVPRYLWNIEQRRRQRPCQQAPSVASSWDSTWTITTGLGMLWEFMPQWSLELEGLYVAAPQSGHQSSAGVKTGVRFSF
jgi:hypothetical protein